MDGDNEVRMMRDCRRCRAAGARKVLTFSEKENAVDRKRSTASPESRA